MTILSPDQIDVIERMGVVCVAVESLFETARSAAESEKRYTDLRDAVLDVQRQYREVLDSGMGDETLSYVVDDLETLVARVERSGS